jgi:hypothetical protein
MNPYKPHLDVGGVANLHIEQLNAWHVRNPVYQTLVSTPGVTESARLVAIRLAAAALALTSHLKIC